MRPSSCGTCGDLLDAAPGADHLCLECAITEFAGYVRDHPHQPRAALLAHGLALGLTAARARWVMRHPG